MTLGCCVGNQTLYNSSKDRLKPFQDWGYDFIELPVAWFSTLDEDEFEDLVRDLRQTDLTVGACNVFLPPDLALIGPRRDPNATRAYVEKAMERIHRLGTSIVVFGSGKARSFPDGYPAETAWNELRDFCLEAADLAAEKDITLVLEPLRLEESNVINTVGAGRIFVERLHHPHMKLLADTFHMESVGESFEILPAAAPLLYHVHTADTSRKYPGSGEYDHAAFFQKLHEINYQGGVSVECHWTDFDQEAPLAAQHLRKEMAPWT